MRCGITDFGSCIPQIMFDFVINLLNAPIQPLLSLVKLLLVEPVQLSLFISLWAIMVYVISLFYGILMLYSGVNFILSGYDIVKRAKAKEWFRNIFIMVVLVQASYFIYDLIVDVGSLLAQGVFNLIDPSFFLMTADNITNIGLQFIFASFYVFVLMIAVIFLVFRYIIVAVGVVLVPVGVFLYFIPPLNGYGRLILNFLGVCIFMSFFNSIILLVCSKLLEVPLFQNFKILIMISAFLLISMLMFYLMFFSLIKSALKTGTSTAGTVASVAKYFA